MITFIPNPNNETTFNSTEQAKSKAKGQDRRGKPNFRKQWSNKIKPWNTDKIENG